jgi:hypothetical protein
MPAMDGECRNVFLHELAARCAACFLLVVYDGAPCPSEGVLDLPDTMRVVNLPLHSPNLTPSENNWDDMRETFFHNLVFDSMRAVENQLVLACHHYEAHPEIIPSRTAWKWIINY